MRKWFFFALAALLTMTAVAVVLRRALSPAEGPLKVTFVGYTNGVHPVFQLTNLSSHSLRLAPFASLVTQEGQAFGSFPLPGSFTNGLSPHTSYTVTIPPPLSGSPWRVRFDPEPAGWQKGWRLAKMTLRKMGLPIRTVAPSSAGACSEVVQP